jgi:hypothetical protein
MFPKEDGVWTQTEYYNSLHMGDDDDNDDDGEPDHVKVCALLTKDQFVSFVNTYCLSMEDVQTMGSIGAPGFGFGWAPAMSFNCDFPDYYDGGGGWGNAYVTPIPIVDKVEDLETFDVQIRDHWWDRIYKVMLAKFE